MSEKLYLIWDNLTFPFLVKITDNDVFIYKQKDIKNTDDKDEINKYYEYNKKNFNILVKYYKNVEKIFIGSSPKIPMTEYSGKYGRKYYGNNILLNIKDKKYVYIGEEIYSFIAYDDIKKFVSPIGNSGVPYSYAIDKDDRYYIFMEKIVFKYNSKSDKKLEIPCCTGNRYIEPTLPSTYLSYDGYPLNVIRTKKTLKKWKKGKDGKWHKLNKPRFNTKQKDIIRKNHDTKSAEAWMYDIYNVIKPGEKKELLKIEYKKKINNVKIIHDRIY